MCLKFKRRKWHLQPAPPACPGPSAGFCSFSKGNFQDSPGSHTLTLAGPALLPPPLSWQAGGQGLQGSTGAKGLFHTAALPGCCSAGRQLPSASTGGSLHHSQVPEQL